MYQFEKTLFGEFERYHYFDENHENQFSIVPARGLNLLELRLQGQPLLDAYPDAAALKVGEWYKNALLFPFPNRLKAGQYTHEGQTYQFPINEPSTQTALHGFGDQVAFHVTKTLKSETGIEVHCQYDDPGDRPYYPFPFRVEARLQLTDTNGFAMKLAFKNTGTQSLPVGLGWHPYFSFGESVDHLNLQLPPCEKVEIDSAMIPTGETTPFYDFTHLAPIAQTNLDNCFQLLPNASGIAEATVESTKGALKYWQESGAGRFPYLQAFTPPNRQSIALEPMSCNIDGLNNGDGLATLQPGEVLEGRFGVSWEPRE